MINFILLTTICITVSCINKHKNEENITSRTVIPTSEEWKLYTEDGCEIFVREMGQGPKVIISYEG